MGPVKDTDKKEIFLYFRRLGNLNRFFCDKKNRPLQEKVKGIYFGEEFCEYCVPSLKEVKEAYKICRIHTKYFYFLTVPASDATLDRYKKVFSFLNNQRERTAVVINDWGVLNLLSRNYINLEPVLGRLLSKNKRFIYRGFTPDLDGICRPDISRIIKNQMSVLRNSNFSVREFRDFLKKYRIRKVDMDIPPQGVKINEEWGISFGLYYPWGYLTRERVCYNNRESATSIPRRRCLDKKCLKLNYNTKLQCAFLNTNLLNIGNVLCYKIGNDNTAYRNFKRMIYEIDLTGRVSFYPSASDYPKIMARNKHHTPCS